VRPIVVAGNWKMHKDLEGSRSLIDGIKAQVNFPLGSTKVIVCPPFTSLALAHDLLSGTPIALGAQNLSDQDEGAFTGETSAAMLKSVGCSYVIVGHSERRWYFRETDALINRKARKALAAGLTAIICVGETLEEREKGVTEQIVSTQVKGVLADFSGADVASSIVAYEPVWAIGTGKTATPAQAQEVHALIRTLIKKAFGEEVASRVVVQYGGSVKPENARELMLQPDIDGALVGGACLKADSFAAIIKAGTAKVG
jgi:triosephosphate isomerase